MQGGGGGYHVLLEKGYPTMITLLILNSTHNLVLPCLMLRILKLMRILYPPLFILVILRLMRILHPLHPFSKCSRACVSYPSLYLCSKCSSWYIPPSLSQCLWFSRKGIKMEWKADAGSGGGDRLKVGKKESLLRVWHKNIYAPKR